jgi:hypothetical protein
VHASGSTVVIVVLAVALTLGALWHFAGPMVQRRRRRRIRRWYALGFACGVAAGMLKHRRGGLALRTLLR